MSGVIRLCYHGPISRGAGRQSLISLATSDRWYSCSLPSLEEDAGAATNKDDSAELRRIAREYGRRKSAYNKQVSKLRKNYMEEYQRNKAEDEALRDAEIAEGTRRRLERQRAKNERSVENAIRQEELRRQNRLAFEDHIKVQQEKRNAEKVLFTKARQLVIDELEEEAPLWLTTAEEVEAAFTPEAEQLLWARPQGVLGAPNPSLDSHFWQFECHTWDMSKTYKTQKAILLEEYEDDVYADTNVDSDFWTPERVQAREEIELKAQLRANVRLEGRKSLMKRQREFLDEEGETPDGEPPRPMPVPSLGVLGNVNAQEKEGAELLLKNPTKFFVFDRNKAPTQSGDDESYSGPTLGVPVALKDPLRFGSPQGRVFPRGIGKLPKPDMRSEKEKKRQEREDKLWAAAQAQARSEMDEIDLAADDDMEFRGEPLDYDNNEDWDSDDEEWVKGLDPDRDSDILNVPREFRYREDDIDWLIQKLENKAGLMQSHVQNTIESMEQETRSQLGRDGEEADIAVEKEPFLDEITVGKLQSVGAEVAKFENLMSSLSQEQLLSLFGLEASRRKASEEATTSVFEEVPGLTSQQISELAELEELLKKAEALEEESSS